MAESEIIKKSDLVEANAIKDALQDPMLQFVDILDAKVQPAILKLAKSLDQTLRNFKIEGSGLDDLKKINEATKQANDLAVISEKVNKAKAQSAAALEKLRQEEIKTTQVQIAVEEKKHKSDEKKIVLSDKEIAQAQIEKQNKSDNIKLLKAEIIEMDKTVGTLQRVEAANTRLRLERKKLDTETAEGAARLKQINAELDRNNKYIVENSDKLKQQKLNVGNYTDSIKKAFEGTGILGESINKYLNIITTFSEKLESLVGTLTKQKEATKAATAATEANAAAEEANAAATAEASAAEKINTTSLEAQTVATETATVATEGLGTALKALAKNPVVLAIAGIAALAKIVYDNVTATDKNRDAIKSNLEGLKAWISNIFIAGVDSTLYGAAVAGLTAKIEELEDKQIDQIVTIQRLRTEAAKAREDAVKEGVTTQQRIKYLDEYISKNKEATGLEIEHAKELAKAYSDFKNIAIAAGKDLSDEQRRQIEEAQAHVEELIEQQKSETIKAQRQQTTLIDQYNNETRQMLQDAQKQEIELIDTFSKYKAEQLQKQIDKELKLNELDTKQAVENEKRKQQLLGAITPAFTDDKGIFHETVDNTKDFERELADIQKAGDAKAIALKKKTNEEILKLQEDVHQKQLDAEKKYQDDLLKLQEEVNKLLNDDSRVRQNNELQKNQIEIEHQQNEIKDLQEKRNEEIAAGKKQKHLSIDELKAYFNTIDSLQAQHDAIVKQNLKYNSEIQKQDAVERTNDAIHEIRERFRKEREEMAKQIQNAEPDQKIAKQKIGIFNSDSVKRESALIQEEYNKLTAQIKLIDDQLKGDLSKSDEDALKKKREHLKSQQDVIKQSLEDEKKAREQFAKDIKKIEDDITSGIQEGLQKRSELQQQADQRDIDYHKRIIDVQAKLAAAGQDNILAEEQARADKAEENKLQDAKKAAKVQEDITIIKTFADTLQAALEAQPPKPFLQAFGEATAASGIVAAAFARLFSGTALLGTEDTGKTTGKGIDGKGGMAWIVHPNERIIKEEHNEQLDGISNEELVKIVKDHKKKTEKNVKNVTNEKNVSSEKNKSTEKNIINVKTDNKSSEVIRITEKDLTGIVHSLVNESVLNKENVSEKTKTSEVEKKKVTDIIVNNFKEVFSKDVTFPSEKKTANKEQLKDISKEVIRENISGDKPVNAGSEKVNDPAPKTNPSENIYNSFSTVAKLVGGNENKQQSEQDKTESIEKPSSKKDAAASEVPGKVISDYAFENIYTPNFKASNVNTTQVKEKPHDSILAERIEKRLDALQKTIESKPVPNVNLGRLGEWSERIGNTIIHHKKQNSRRSLRLNG